MDRQELKKFYNKGFGWVCKNCETKFVDKNDVKSRLMTEGEAESKQPVFSNKAMAKWTNDEQNTLICPICEMSEKI